MTKLERWIVWGYTKPGYCAWAAVLPSGKIHIVSEWLFRETVASDVAKEILDRTRDVTALLVAKRHDVRNGKSVGSSDMWPKEDAEYTESTAGMFAKQKLALTRGSENRLGGWQRLRHWLRLAPDFSPWLQLSASCTYALRTLPFLIADADNPEDLPMKGENDQVATALRIGVMARPTPTILKAQPPIMLADSIKALATDMEPGRFIRRPMGMVS